MISDFTLNRKKLAEMLDALEKKAELHSIVVTAKGETILEGAWAPYTLEEPQMLHSLSKLGTSLCVGIAVGEGRLHLEEPILPYLKEDLPENPAPELQKLTVEDLLTMQAGSRRCCNNVYFKALACDWETAWLQEERDWDVIGKGFRYDSGCSYTLSVIVSRVMGQTCAELLQERVFDPMGLGTLNWQSSPEGYSVGGWGMYLTTRQIAGLGQLLLQNGNWNGEQLIPADWMEKVTAKQVEKPGMAGRTLSHYGYHMHVGERLYAAEGAFQQLLLCFREYPISVAITSGTYCDKVPDICEKYILEALEEGEPTDEAETERQAGALAEQLNTLALPLAQGEGCTVPDSLQNQWILLERQPRDMEAVLLRQTGEKELRVKVRYTDGSYRTFLAEAGQWHRNDTFLDLTKRYHCLSYGVKEGALYLSDAMLNTSYREEYMLAPGEEPGIFRCTWKPNVTYMDGKDPLRRAFGGKSDGK